MSTKILKSIIDIFNQPEIKKRLSIIFLIVPPSLAFFFYLSRNTLIDFYHFEYFTVDLLFGTFSIVSILGLLMFYLQTGFKRVPPKINSSTNINTDISQQKIDTLELELNTINEKLNNLEKHGITNPAELNKEKLTELQELIKSKLINETTEELIKELEVKVENKINSDNFLFKIKNEFSNTLERLRREVTTLNFRSNLNLALGIMITGVGIYLLYRFVFNGDLKQHDNTLSFILNFAPKLSLVIFIEIFAFFFLSLYKTSLSEIKYYQNEMTKIETKYIALVTALELKSDDILSEILKELPNNIAFNEQNGEFSGNGESGDFKLQQAKVNADNMVAILGKVLDVYKKAN
ncbi:MULTISPECIES: hypothetical protein [Bacillaceae]|uniref:hypothetical protein n=1 Tax=Bacillaceae TaxID=186817 RepID=UPI0006605749|nr:MULTISPECIES: hypothetical protein [Bacillaceae]MCF7623662.1 hypothetical protein [Peribacillus frigoritolerans]PRA94498.1 hypothetical protein CQ056_05280 [Peribacillus simplex]